MPAYEICYIDDSGNLVGLEIDMAHAIAKDLLGDPNKVEFVVLQSDGRFPAALSGKIDFGLFQTGFALLDSQLCHLHNGLCGRSQERGVVHCDTRAKGLGMAPVVFNIRVSDCRRQHATGHSSR